MEAPTSPPSAPKLPTTPEARAAYIKAAQAKPDLHAITRLFEAELRAHPALPEAMAPCLPQARRPPWGATPTPKPPPSSKGHFC